MKWAQRSSVSSNRPVLSEARQLTPGRFLVLLLGASALVSAQISPNGAEFQINTYTPYGQANADVAAAPQGGFVVVWDSWGSNGSDTEWWSVQARLYAPSGSAQGQEFQVNSYTTGGQIYPVSTWLAGAGFVVAWQSNGSAGGDTSSYSIQAQRYSAAGTPLGAQFLINDFTTDYQGTPSITADAAGNFVVVWTSFGSLGSDSDLSSIQARRFAPNGTPLGTQFQVNTLTTDQQLGPAVAADAQGNFVVAWTSNGSVGTDTSGTSIQARRYSSNGAPLGGQFQVNSYTTGDQQHASIALAPQSGFVVAWQSDGSPSTDSDYWSIHTRRFDENGNSLGPQFQVNTYTTLGQVEPSIAMDDAGKFVVAWASYGSDGTDTEAYSVHARRYASSGAALGDPFQVNSYTRMSQDLPEVSLRGSGDFVVVWTSDASFGSDNHGESAHGQRFDDLFSDGVESGDTDRWSNTVP